MTSVANRLIEGLPRKARHQLLGMCEAVELDLGEVLYDRDASARHIYFPTGSTLSLRSSPGDLPVLEIGMVGNEGVLGAHIALGVGTSATFAQVRGAGSAWRMTTARFKAELTRSAPLERSIRRYLHVTILQHVSMARCSRFHNLDQRLARLLLMTHDRAQADTFGVTHELMASMLDVRRGVSRWLRRPFSAAPPLSMPAGRSPSLIESRWKPRPVPVTRLTADPIRSTCRKARSSVAR